MNANKANEPQCDAINICLVFILCWKEIRTRPRGYTVMITIIFYYFILDRKSNSIIFAIFCPIPNKCLVAIAALLATSKEFVLILLSTCLQKRPPVTFLNLLLP